MINEPMPATCINAPHHDFDEALGVRRLFGHLATLPGNTWQERWEASGFNNEGASSVNSLARPGVGYDSSNLISALRMAFSLRVFQPSLSLFQPDGAGHVLESSAEQRSSW